VHGKYAVFCGAENQQIFIDTDWDSGGDTDIGNHYLRDLPLLL
jgi:hypothetical protein